MTPRDLPTAATLPAPGSVLVRIARPADVDGVRDLAHAVAAQPLLVRYGTRPDRLASDLCALCGAAPDTPREEVLLLAYSAPPTHDPDGNPPLLGFARIQLGGAAGGHFGRGGYLRLIALRPGHESRGVGRSLLSSVEETVRAAHRDLFLLTSDFNHGAQRFYERAGYLRVGALPDFVRAGITELLYWKRLST